MRMVPSPVKRYAGLHGLELFQPESLKTPEAVARLHAAQPEAMVVAAYGLILPPAVLAIPRRGALNIHASLLPRWRGAAPIQRALLAGDLESGVSIMQMDPGLDTGPVFSQRPIPIAPDEDAAGLHDKLATLGAELMGETLKELEAGRAHAVPQPKSGESYAHKIEKQDTILDWARPADELERAVRAFRPAPGAVTQLEGAPLKIWRASVLREPGQAGTLTRAVAEGIVVGCGKDSLVVTELQRPGGRRLPATEFLRGRVLNPGTRFG
jgi:methionyl-tRNA formyltransferase